MKSKPKNKIPKYSNLSVDCVVFGYSNDKLNVLLINRKGNANFSAEQFALPGDLVAKSESLDEAADRILYSLTEFKGIYLQQFHTFGNINRVSTIEDQEWLRASKKKPEARVITVAYYALVKTDDYTPVSIALTGETQWVPIGEIPKLTFDHNQIVEKAYSHLKENLIDKQIGFELLPKKFTLSELQFFYETILGVSYDKRNFRKSLKGKTYLKKLDEKVQGQAHRPANLYIYKKD